MKIKQEDVQVGDVLLMAKNAIMTAIKVIGITKSGSIKYTFADSGWGIDGRDYYDRIELDVTKHNKTLYFKQAYTPEHQAYFWLLNRDNGSRSYQ